MLLIPIELVGSTGSKDWTGMSGVIPILMLLHCGLQLRRLTMVRLLRSKRLLLLVP